MREGTAGVRSSMLGPPAVHNTAGKRENHAFSRKRHPADVRPLLPRRLKMCARNVINQTFATPDFCCNLAKLRVCREGVPGRGTGSFPFRIRVPGFVLTNPGIERSHHQARLASAWRVPLPYSKSMPAAAMMLPQKRRIFVDLRP